MQAELIYRTQPKEPVSRSSRTTKNASTTSRNKVNPCIPTPSQQLPRPDHLAGYNEVDTARAYVGGAQEAFTREAHWQDRGLTLATKCFPREPGDHAADKVKASLSKSLSELGASCVDIFYLHAPDRSVPFEETLAACNELHKQGKFVQLGLSNYAAWEVAEIVQICKAHNYVRPTVYQAMYNAITRAIDDELVPCCRKHGLDIVVYNPLAGGIFSGKYRSKDHEAEAGRYADASGPTAKLYRERYFQDATFAALALIEPVAHRHGLTLLEVALRWCVHHSLLKVRGGGGRDGVIIGVSSLAQLESNLTDLEKGPLPDEVVQTLDKAWETQTKATCPLYWR